MHPTFISGASAFVFASLLSSTSAGVVDLFAREKVCTIDVVYKGLWDNPEIDYAATPYCVSALGLVPVTVTVATATPIVTIAPTTSITGVSITSTTEYRTTVTITTTELVLNYGMEATAGSTKRAERIVAGLEKFEGLVGRQMTSGIDAADAQYSAVLSACSCRPGLNAGMDYITATASPRTVTDAVFYSFAMTKTDTVHKGRTTTTLTVQVTSDVGSLVANPVSATTSAWSHHWSGSWSGTLEGTWAEAWETTTSSISTDTYSSMATTSPISSPSNTTSNSAVLVATTTAESFTTTTNRGTYSPATTSGETSSTTRSWSYGTWSATPSTTKYHNTTGEGRGGQSVNTNTASAVIGPQNTSTTTETTSMTTSMRMTSSTSVPSGCPGVNGTFYDDGAYPCMLYQRVCGRSYKARDFYNSEEFYPTPESCTALCDAQNAGHATPCLGIVWNITAIERSPNCQQLKSTANPINDGEAIALILVPNPAPFCQPNSSTTWVMSRTSSTLSSWGTWGTWNTSSINSLSASPTTSVEPYNSTTTISLMNMTSTGSGRYLTSSTPRSLYNTTTTTSFSYNNIWSYPTTWSQPTTWSPNNHSRSHYHIYPHTHSKNHTSMTTTSVSMTTNGTTTLVPVSTSTSLMNLTTSNSTCLASTVTLTSHDTMHHTILVTTTLYVGNLTETETEYLKTTMTDPRNIIETMADLENTTDPETTTETDYTKTKTKVKGDIVSTVTDKVAYPTTVTMIASGEARWGSGSGEWWRRH